MSRDCAVPYARQAVTAEALFCLGLIAAAAGAGRDQLDMVRAIAARARRDFYTCVAAGILGIDYYDVMAIERAAVKSGLFVYMYATHSDKVTHIMGSTIVERLA